MKNNVLKADLAVGGKFNGEKISVQTLKDQVDVATPKISHDTAAELQKATAHIEEFKERKAEAIVKIKTAKVTEIIRD